MPTRSTAGRTASPESSPAAAIAEACRRMAAVFAEGCRRIWAVLSEACRRARQHQALAVAQVAVVRCRQDLRRHAPGSPERRRALWPLYAALEERNACLSRLHGDEAGAAYHATQAAALRQQGQELFR